MSRETIRQIAGRCAQETHGAADRLVQLPGLWTAWILADQGQRGERDIPAQGRQPAARVAGPSAIPARGQRDQAVPEAGAVNDAAVAAYRLSAQAGNPLSERKLAQMFGRTSRRWARARIADARRVPSSGLMVDPAVTVGAQSR